MAVEKVPGLATGRIIIETGMSSGGEPEFANRNYSSIKATATDQDIYDVLQSIGTLQKYPVSKVLRLDQAELVSE